MIFLLNKLIECIYEHPDKIHHLAQFRSFEESLDEESLDEESIKLYATYILTNLINSFNPHKLYLQKTAFNKRIEKNTYNSHLFIHICTFYDIIYKLSKGEKITTTMQLPSLKKRRHINTLTHCHNFQIHSLF